MKKLAVHFGAGALGRGLTIPFLQESGFDVVTIDTDKQLISSLQQQRGYDIFITDLHKTQHIPLITACHVADLQVASYLSSAQLITTSVGKENLHHIAVALTDIQPKTVICCENIEHSGQFFAELLEQKGINSAQWMLPDCMVDRICSANWPDSLVVETECYGLICVEDQLSAEIPDKFKKTNNIDAEFQQKRILVNTYADGIAFLGQAYGLEYLYQAAENPKINHLVDGYMQVMQRYLQIVYHFEPTQLSIVAEQHRHRLQNPAIKRRLDTVARNFLDKIAPQERFIFPLNELIRHRENIDQALPFLRVLIDSWVNQQSDPVSSRQQVFNTINNPYLVKKIEAIV